MSSEIVSRAIDHLHEELDELENNVKESQRNVDRLAAYLLRIDDLYAKGFESAYLGCVMTLRDTMGISLQMIIEIDAKGERREKVEQPSPNPGVTVYNQPPPQPTPAENHEEQGKGLGEYVMEYLKERALQKKELGPTQILQSVEVVDVLNLGRQALPALNNLLRWHEDNVCHLKIFDTPDARWYFNKREKGYLTRLLNTVTSFLIAAENYSRTRTSEKITRVGEAVARQGIGNTGSQPAGPTR